MELVTLPVSSPQRLPAASKTGERLPVRSILSGVLISHSNSFLRWFPGGTFPRNSLGVLRDPRLVGSVLRFCRLWTNCPLGLRGLSLPSKPSVCRSGRTSRNRSHITSSLKQIQHIFLNKSKLFGQCQYFVCHSHYTQECIGRGGYISASLRPSVLSFLLAVQAGGPLFYSTASK